MRLLTVVLVLLVVAGCEGPEGPVGPQDEIEENIGLISAHFSDTDHLLILVGDKEPLVDDMSCSSHDQDLVAQMFASGDPRFIHQSIKHE